MDIIRAYIHYVNSIVKKYPRAVHKYLHSLHEGAKKEGPKSLFFSNSRFKEFDLYRSPEIPVIRHRCLHHS